MDKYIIMSQKELKKYDIIKKVINKELKGIEAADLLNVTDRHIRRLKMKVKDHGAKGLVHGGRGRPSNRKIPDKERGRIVDLINKNYHDFGPTLATEKLNERHKMNVSTSVVRSIMIKENIWKPKNKKKEKHRSWRQRRASSGEMIQYDGSYEYWFEDRGKKCCLLASIDDATGKVWAQFDEHEGVEPTFRFWQGYIERFGKPYSIYVDKFSTYSMNHKLAKENPDTLTQFQRAMEKGLNIEIIHAHSAEAKGRVEKPFKTLQDRLIKEMRLRDISDIKTTNKFLEEEYLPWFNARFRVEPRSKADLHKKLTKKEANNIEAVFSRQYERVVRNDFTIHHQKQRYQLLKEQSATICKRDKVTAEMRLDGSIHFRLRGKYLNYQILPSEPKKMNNIKNANLWVIPKSPKYIPPANHPWRQAVYNHK
jgi:transposase-like protein